MPCIVLFAVGVYTRWFLVSNEQPAERAQSAVQDIVCNAGVWHWAVHGCGRRSLPWTAPRGAGHLPCSHWGAAVRCHNYAANLLAHVPSLTHVPNVRGDPANMLLQALLSRTLAWQHTSYLQQHCLMWRQSCDGRAPTCAMLPPSTAPSVHSRCTVGTEHPVTSLVR